MRKRWEQVKTYQCKTLLLSDRVKTGEITLKFVPTEEMLADLLTKPLQGALFQRLRNSLMNWSCT